MYDFLLQTIFFVSLGVVVYMLARAVPRVSESGEVMHVEGRLDRLLARLPLHKIDDRLNALFEKILRTLKVWIMKSENVVDDRMDRLKAHLDHQEKKTESANLFEKISENSEEK